MAIKELGYVIIETALAAQWHDFLTNVAGVMAGEDTGDGARHYRIDDRPFRFRIEEAAEERLAAAAYEIDTRDALNALAGRIEAAGQALSWGDEADCAARQVEAYFRTHDPAGNGLEFYVGDARDAVEEVKSALEPKGFQVFAISSATNEGLTPLLEALEATLTQPSDA